MLLTGVSDIDDKILTDASAALIYVTQKDDIKYMEVVEDLARDYGTFMNIGLFVVDDLQKS
jgi:hypothetical protein